MIQIHRFLTCAWMLAIFILAFALMKPERSSSAIKALAQIDQESQTFDDFQVVDAFPEMTFEYPVGIENMGDERLFIVEQPGRLLVLHPQGKTPVKEVFLDISDRVHFANEMGLLGLAFHPTYGNNGTFFVNYTHLNGSQLSTRISRFEVTADPDRADPQSEKIILEVPQPYANHNGGKLAFGPDGYLYIGLGDGGAAGDPGDRAQNLDELLGKMLRIDVDRTAGGKDYAIPVDNPFRGMAAREEIWAYGLRNPWQFNFDPLTGDLYIGDVGQGKWEEVDFQPADSPGGENYGWRLKEGQDCFNPAVNCDPAGITVDPIYQYGHDQGCSITGGLVYHGEKLAELRGTYLFVDYCAGILQGVEQQSDGRWTAQPLLFAGNFIAAFGNDQHGELLMAKRDSGQILTLRKLTSKVHIPLIAGR